MEKHYTKYITMAFFPYNLKIRNFIIIINERYKSVYDMTYKKNTFVFESLLNIIILVNFRLNINK